MKCLVESTNKGTEVAATTSVGLLSAIMHSQNTCDISMLETYYLNFIASQLYTQKWLKCSESV